MSNISDSAAIGSKLAENTKQPTATTTVRQVGVNNTHTYQRKRTSTVPSTMPPSMSLHSIRNVQNDQASAHPTLKDQSSNKNNIYSRKTAQLSSPLSPSNHINSNSITINIHNNLNNNNINNINEAEYSGPKLYKRLTGKSNKLTIINSLNQLVLAGVVNANVRKQVIEEIEMSEARHFVILFRDYHLQYRGVYSYTTETDFIEKVIGTGPQKISEDMIEKYYKYNSGGKQFSPVPTKHFSVQCDAVTIHSVYWASRKTSAPVTNLTQMTHSNSTLNVAHPSSNSSHNTLRR
jgi:hypothetical protein